jgi:hypothetical protein
MLRKTSRNRLIGFVLTFATAMPVAMGQTGATRIVMSTQRVAEAMASAGMVAEPGQIDLLSGVSTTREDASVQVVSVAHRAGGTVKVKLRCSDNHDCLPFYVLVHGLNGVDATPKMGAASVATASANNIIRGGDHAILILETPDAWMRFPVVCLQGGVVGQKVRAASPDRKQFYDAEVVGAGLLKGKL